MKKYMIITRQHYEDIMQLVLNKDKQVQSLIKQVKVLENDKKILLKIINPDIADLDFPNSDKGGNNDFIDPDQVDIWSI